MRTIFGFLLVAALLVTPWWIASTLGWDDDAAILANGAPATVDALLCGGAAVASHIVALTLAPMAVGAALVRAGMLLVGAWTARRSGLSSAA